MRLSIETPDEQGAFAADVLRIYCILPPPTFIDEPSGNGVLNGIPVTVAAIAT